MKRLRLLLGLMIVLARHCLVRWQAWRKAWLASSRRLAGYWKTCRYWAQFLGMVAAGFVGLRRRPADLAAVKGAMVALGISATGMWTAITGPIGLAVLAVVGVIALFQLLYNKVEPFRNSSTAWATRQKCLRQSSNGLGSCQKPLMKVQKNRLRF